MAETNTWTVHVALPLCGKEISNNGIFAQIFYWMLRFSALKKPSKKIVFYFKKIYLLDSHEAIFTRFAPNIPWDALSMSFM